MIELLVEIIISFTLVGSIVVGIFLSGYTLGDMTGYICGWIYHIVMYKHETIKLLMNKTTRVKDVKEK